MARTIRSGDVQGVFVTLSHLDQTPETGLIVLPMELWGRIKLSAYEGPSGAREQRFWTLVLPADSPAVCRVEIDGSSLVHLARRACVNKSRRAKAGPVTIKAKLGRVEREEGWK